MPDFMMAGDELDDIGLAGRVQNMKARRDVATVSTKPGAPKIPPNGGPKQPTAGRDVQRIHKVRAIPIRGGIPMRGPKRTPLNDGLTRTISPESMGVHLTNKPTREVTEFAGLASDGFMPGLGDFERHAVPFEHVPQFAGFAGDGMLPDMGGLAGLGKRIRHTSASVMGTPQTRNLSTAGLGKRLPVKQSIMLRGPRTTKMVGTSGKMLPGLSAELETEVVGDGMFSAGDLYDAGNDDELAGNDGMLPGLGLDMPDTIMGMDTKAVMIGAGALLAFWWLARKRYAR